MNLNDFLRIGIVADDKTGKGLASAKKNVSALDKTVAKLGRTFASVFAAQKIYQFGKASVKAFADDQAAAAKLAGAVKNLGLAMSAPEVEAYIQSLQNTSGVIDDKLRPAMQSLLTTTGSVKKSQELLAQAIDISRGSGEDLVTVASDLSNAYVGNVKGLRKYYLGLSQAELKAMSFTEIQKKLANQFKGSSAAYLDTYAGKLEVLNTAMADVKETIGKGLLDLFGSLAGDGGVQGVADAFKNMAEQVALATSGLTKFFKEFDKMLAEVPGNSILDKIGSNQFLQNLASGGLLFAILAKSNESTGKVNTNRSSSPAGSWKKTTEQRKAEELAAKRAKELAAAQAKQAKALKDQALLKKQSALFDMQQIELVAAMKEKLSKEDQNRVLLQLALLQGNESEAARLTAQIADSIDQTGKLKAYLNSVTIDNNPFKAWLDTLQQIATTTAQIASSAGTGAGPTGVSIVGNTDVGGHVIGSLVPNFTPPTNYGTTGGTITDASGFAGVGPIVVQIDGKAVATALQDQSLSGNNTTVYRSKGAFNIL